MRFKNYNIIPIRKICIITITSIYDFGLVKNKVFKTLIGKILLKKKNGSSPLADIICDIVEVFIYIHMHRIHPSLRYQPFFVSHDAMQF